nr:uncharacterized protein LOC108074223 [Drosophila kikkawai]
MKFLLLCSAALLLLATSAITIQAALAEDPMIPTASSENAFSTIYQKQLEEDPISHEDKKQLEDKLKPKKSELRKKNIGKRKLQGELANAKARLNILEDDKKPLEDKTSELNKKNIAAARELEETKKQLQETQYKLDMEISRKEKRRKPKPNPYPYPYSFDQYQ